MPNLRSALLAALLLVTPTLAGAADLTVRIGYQKYGNLVLLKASGLLETALKPLGVSVEWKQFIAGPALMEALGAGAIDVGAATTEAGREVDDGEAKHPDEAAAELGEASKLPAPVVATALARQAHGVAALSPEVTAGQQAVADTFLALHLIPKKLDVASTVWKPGT